VILSTHRNDLEEPSRFGIWNLEFQTWGYFLANKVIENYIKKVGKLLLEKKAEDIVILDLRGLTDFAQFFIICTATSEVHSHALCDYIVETLEKEGLRPFSIEGYTYGRWVLIDYIDFIIHIFLQDVREYYNLELLWGDAPKLELKE